MAWTDTETKKWLMDDLGFTDAEATEMLPKFAGERAQKVESFGLRQQDYSKRMNDLTKAQADLTAANEKLNADLATWATLTASEKDQATKLRADLEKSQQDVLKLTQVVNRVAAEAGLDPTKIMEGFTPPKKEDPPAPTVDLSGYAKTNQLAEMAAFALQWPVMSMQIARDHRALTGEDVDLQAVATELQTRAGARNNQKSLDPRVIWEELNEIPAKRAAAEKKRVDDLVAAAEARGREAGLSEARIPGHQPSARHAPVFHTPTGEQRKSALDRPQPQTGTQAAISAFRTGKYRPAGSSAK